MSIQLIPASSASWIAAIESSSSWLPQANAQPAPPMAQAPNPSGVICKSESPSSLVFIDSPYWCEMELVRHGILHPSGVRL